MSKNFPQRKNWREIILIENRYLFSTDDSTYIIYYAGDVQWNPQDSEQEAVYTQTVSEIEDIEIAISNGN